MGKLAPDLELKTSDGRTRVAELLRSARSVAWAAPSGAPDPAAGLDEALRSWLGPAPPAAGQ